MSSRKLGLQFNEQSLKAAVATTEKYMLDHTEWAKFKSCSRYIFCKDKNQSGRISGSGRKFKCEDYPELTNTMLALVGFSSQPRLICDILFLS